jgi:hypothetical protein
MARGRRAKKTPRPGDKYLKEAQGWKEKTGVSRAVPPRPRPNPGGTGWMVDQASQEETPRPTRHSISVPRVGRQPERFPEGETLSLPRAPREGPVPGTPSQPSLPGLATPPGPGPAPVKQPAPISMDPSLYPRMGGQDHTEAPGGSQSDSDVDGIICPLLGSQCLGPRCMWFDQVANNCAVVSQLDYASGIRGELSVLMDYLRILEKRIGGGYA